jgi:hypothetical protein
MTLNDELTDSEKKVREVRIEIAMKMRQNNELLHKILAYTGVTKEEIIKGLENIPPEKPELTDMEEYIIEKRAKEVAKIMKHDGRTTEFISKITNLNKEQIEAL